MIQLIRFGGFSCVILLYSTFSCSSPESQTRNELVIPLDTLANEAILDTCSGGKIFLEFCEGISKESYIQLTESYFNDGTLSRLNPKTGEECSIQRIWTDNVCSGFIELNITRQSKLYIITGEVFGFFDKSKLLDSVNIIISSLNFDHFIYEDFIEKRNRKEINVAIEEARENLKSLVGVYSEKYGEPTIKDIPNKWREYRWLYGGKVIRIDVSYKKITSFREILKKSQDQDYKQPYLGTTIDRVKISYLTPEMEASVRQEKEELRKKENKLKKKSIDDQKLKRKETIEKI